MLRHLAPGGPAAALVVWLLACLAGACAEEPTSVPGPNRPPSVAISAGPIRDSVTSYVVTFHWTAADPDGRVEGFLYAIDDTAGPGDWSATARHEVTIAVSAADSAGVDSIYAGLPPAPLLRYRFRGAHTFFLEAIDDRGAASAPVALSFTSETFAPETRIVSPRPGGVIALGPAFTISWQGDDPDGTEDPVGYSFRVVAVPNVVVMTPEDIERALLDPASPGEPWSPFAARTSARLDLATPQDYVFGVVAVDQAGAVEPRLRSGPSPGPTNTLRIRARATGGQPRLTVVSAARTTTFPTADASRKTFQVPGSVNVSFTWTADASPYGGRIAGYSYGIDLADLDAANPGWAPESPSLTRVALRFDLPPGARAEEHMLYVRARDEVGSTTIADVHLVVLPFTRERDIVLVDDVGGDWTGRSPEDCTPPPPPGLINPGADFPQDQCHDQFLRDSIERALGDLGRPESVVDRYEPLDPRTGQVRRGPVEVDSTSFGYRVYSGPVTLEHLARYRAVIWNTRGAGSSQLAALTLPIEENALASYLVAGGHVLITGPGAFSCTNHGNIIIIDPRGPFCFKPGDFVYEFLKIWSLCDWPECAGGCFRAGGETRMGERESGFKGASQSPAALAEGFPRLRVARPPYDGPQRAIRSCEGMVVPYGLDVNPRLEPIGGRLDTLYFYESIARSATPPRRSYMDGAACGLRYSGPGQGKLMMFGFPLYFMPPSQVDSVMAASLRWFLDRQ